jgi:fructose-specific component phosphotransferase system IIB-like protein
VYNREPGSRRNAPVYSQPMIRILAAALLVCTFSAHAQQYDLVLRNGQVLDPKNNVNAKRDVAIRDGKIAAIEPTIPMAQSFGEQYVKYRQKVKALARSFSSNVL